MNIKRNSGAKKRKTASFGPGRMFADEQAERETTETKQFYTHVYGAKVPTEQERVGGLFDSITSNNLRAYRMIISAKHEELQNVNIDPGNAEVILGAHDLADLRLEGRGVADFHARVNCLNGSLTLLDLGSKKGTFLDGKRLSAGASVPLNEKSVVKIQHYFISFESISNLTAPQSPRLITQKAKDAEVEQPYIADNILLSHLIQHQEHINKWSASVTELSVVEVIAETADVKTFRLASKQALVFHYQPGQFVTLILHIDDKEVRRSYSIAATPSRPHIIEITVKRVPDGLVSNWLCDQIEVGDRLKIKGPSGNFSCFNYPARKVLFLAAGSGIVPIMSMLRWISDSGAEVDARLLMSFRKPSDVIYGKELALLGKRHENIKIGLTLTQQGISKERWQGHVGRINRDLVNSFVPDLSERVVFLCGPESFMKSAKEILKGMDLSMDRLHTESFIHDRLSAERKLTAQAIRDAKGKHKVTFAKSGLTVPANGKINLLDLAAAYDIPIDFDCRNGNCGECMVKCMTGKTEMLEDAEIDGRDKASGWIFSCCTYPRSDIVLDA